MSIGIPEADAELQTTYEEFKINALCVRDQSGTVSVACFVNARPLASFAKMFYVLTKTQHSGIFSATWSATMKQASIYNPHLSTKDLESEVWNPAFSHCEKLLQEMYERTITLGDVDKHFKSYNESDIVTQLNLLLHGVNECNQLMCSIQGVHQPLQNHWIPHSVQKIVDYRQLCRYRDAADSFLWLRDVLNLSGGDFSDIEKISREVINEML